MQMLRSLLAVLLLASAAIAGAAPDSIYVMRHLQKEAGQDPPLTAEGSANAGKLADWFGDAAPSVIYVSATRRTRETAAPLAAKLGLTVKEYDPGDSKALVARVAAETGAVLIVGHSNTVPEIVELLGAPRPPAIADDEFGTILLVRDEGERGHTVTWNRLDEPLQ